jgi:hypothetical protein
MSVNLDTAARRIPVPPSVIGAVAISVVFGAATAWNARIVLGALVASAIVALTLSHRAAAVTAVLLLAPATSGIDRGVVAPALRPSEVLVGLVCGTVLLTAGPRVHRLNRFERATLVYVGAAILLGTVDMLERRQPVTFSDIGEVCGPIQFLLLYHAVRLTMVEHAQRVRAVIAIFVGYAGICAVAVAQYFDIGGARAWVAKYTTQTGTGLFEWFSRFGLPRATGPFPQPHDLAGTSFIVGLVAVAVVLDRVEWRLRRVAWITIALVIVTFGTAATATPVLGFGAGILALGVWSGKLGRVLAGMVAVGMAGAAAFSSSINAKLGQELSASGTSGVAPAGSGGFLPSSVSYRINVWETQFLPAMRGHWLLGWGPGIPPSVDWKFTETLYLTMALRGGIILLVIYIWLVVTWIKFARPSVAGAPTLERALSRVTIVGLVCLIPMHSVANYFVNAGLPHVLWAVAGLVAAGQAARRPPDLPREV